MLSEPEDSTRLDDASQSVTGFLESLQDAMRGLRDTWKHYRRHGAHPRRPFLALSARPFHIYGNESVQEFHGCVVMGLPVKGTDGRDYELSVDILWDAERWTIKTEACVDSDADTETQKMLRQPPARFAVDLITCTEEIRKAVADLIRFEDLVPGSLSAT